MILPQWYDTPLLQYPRIPEIPALLCGAHLLLSSRAAPRFLDKFFRPSTPELLTSPLTSHPPHPPLHHDISNQPTKAPCHQPRPILSAGYLSIPHQRLASPRSHHRSFHAIWILGRYVAHYPLQSFILPSNISCLTCRSTLVYNRLLWLLSTPRPDNA